MGKSKKHSAEKQCVWYKWRIVEKSRRRVGRRKTQPVGGGVEGFTNGRMAAVAASRRGGGFKGGETVEKVAKTKRMKFENATAAVVAGMYSHTFTPVHSQGVAMDTRNDVTGSTPHQSGPPHRHRRCRPCGTVSHPPDRAPVNIRGWEGRRTTLEI